MAESVEEIRKHTRVYLNVFAALAALTVLTVGVSYLHISSVAATVFIALVIATVKGSLVACYFMHLIDERKIIYWVLILTLAFFIVLMFVPVLTDTDSVFSE